MTTRPRSEDCQRLTLAKVRPLVQPGDEALKLADGTVLGLRWGAVRGCYGGDRDGRALLLICPSCGRNARVLHRPPAKAWGCWSCTPVSRLSHRRPGARAGCPKPRNWRLEQIISEQYRCADLLGLASWPPRALFWTPADVLALPRRRGARRIRRMKACALALRLYSLETMRWMVPFPAQLTRFAEKQGLLLQKSGEFQELQDEATGLLRATEWAVRRPSRVRRGAVATEITSPTPGISPHRRRSRPKRPYLLPYLQGISAK